MTLLANLHSQINSLIHTAAFKTYKNNIYWSLEERDGFQGCVSVKETADIMSHGGQLMSSFMKTSKLAIEMQPAQVIYFLLEYM